MLDQHTAFRQELHRAQVFLHTVDMHRKRMSTAESPASESSSVEHVSGEDILQHVSVAFEDIPEDMHELVRVMLMHPTADSSLRQRVIDVATNLAGASLGEIEDATKRLSLLHVLTSLGRHSPYTYRVDGKVLRGSRPTPDKLRRLYAGDCRATINLCKEMVDGDDALIAQAGLTGKMETKHIKIVDNTPPEPDQVGEVMDFLHSCAGQVYVHCEAGIGRTGVMVACYRMSKGWSLENALHEAKQFGCSVPDQLSFIEDHVARAGKLVTLLALQPGTDVLSQTAMMNNDPTGLDRALVVPSESSSPVLGSAAPSQSRAGSPNTNRAASPTAVGVFGPAESVIPGPRRTQPLNSPTLVPAEDVRPLLLTLPPTRGPAAKGSGVPGEILQRSLRSASGSA